MNLKNYDCTKDELNAFAYAVIKTDKGDMTLKLYPEEAPITVANFAHLAKSGFYDGLKFHRVISNFVIQGGCPNGTGSGGPGWRILCECDKNIHKHQRGTISMAHAGRNTGGSQFFICHSKQPHLDGVHTVFGDIVDENSIKVLDSIKAGDIIKTIEIKQNI
ncbi:MAG: peptidylprolyl isomerase [Campylobacteraceae bacterium]|nr:peptidylprolyl isomerase [Campylobacteraceae bacterium]